MSIHNRVFGKVCSFLEISTLFGFLAESWRVSHFLAWPGKSDFVCHNGPILTSTRFSQELREWVGFGAGQGRMRPLPQNGQWALVADRAVSHMWPSILAGDSLKHIEFESNHEHHVYQRVTLLNGDILKMTHFSGDSKGVPNPKGKTENCSTCTNFKSLLVKPNGKRKTKVPAVKTPESTQRAGG